MQKEKLKDMHEVQAYFVKRVSKIISSKGKKLIGWDEILEGGDLPKGTTVMSWRGMKGGIEAAKMGHDVVMTPTTFVYLDYMQTDPAIEPPVYATLRLKTTYSFEPVPDGIDPKLIRGGQGNIWTEQIYNTRHLQYMVWPRAFAVAEVLWSPKSKRNFDSFIPRVEAQFARYDILNMKYSPALYDPLVKVKKGNNNEMLVDFDRELNNLDIYYSFDNSFPDKYYPKYEGTSIPVPIDASNLKLIAYRDGKPVGRLITLTSAEMKKRAGIK
jgi:hexosaminidase